MITRCQNCAAWDRGWLRRDVPNDETSDSAPCRRYAPRPAVLLKLHNDRMDTFRARTARYDGCCEGIPLPTDSVTL